MLLVFVMIADDDHGVPQAHEASTLTNGLRSMKIFL
jgi:hypothetical protein